MAGVNIEGISIEPGLSPTVECGLCFKNNLRLKCLQPVGVSWRVVYDGTRYHSPINSLQSVADCRIRKDILGSVNLPKVVLTKGSAAAHRIYLRKLGYQV